MEELKNPQAAPEIADTETPLDKNVRLMSPTRMVVRRFFRSKLSILGLIMVIGLFLFSFVGPLVYTQWGEIELDESGKIEYATAQTTYTVNGVEYTLHQTTEKSLKDNFLAPPSAEHILGTDNEGYDIFVRLMYGGRISLIVSFIAVFLITLLGVFMGGIAGFFGGVVDNIIMRVCDVLICLPGIPILLIISTILDASGIDPKTVSFSCICSDDVKRRCGEVIQAALAEYGVTMNLESMDLATYLSVAAEGDFDTCIGGYTSSSMMGFVEGKFTEKQIGGSNWQRTNDPKIDEMYVEITQILDADARNAKMTELTNYINEICPQVPTYGANVTRAYNDDLQGVKVSAANTLYWGDVSWN
jgi:ABC-type dipeptide/oligopeptide/nickel transport system permease subunit